MILGTWAFVKCLNHKDGAFTNGISTLTKDSPEKSLARSAMWGHRKHWLWTRKRASPECNHAGARMLDFQLSKLRKINFCCLQATQFVVFCFSIPNGLRQRWALFWFFLFHDGWSADRIAEFTQRCLTLMLKETESMTPWSSELALVAYLQISFTWQKNK